MIIHLQSFGYMVVVFDKKKILINHLSFGYMIVVLRIKTIIKLLSFGFLAVVLDKLTISFLSFVHMTVLNTLEINLLSFGNYKHK